MNTTHTRTRYVIAIALATFLLRATATHATSLPWEIWKSPDRLAILDGADSVLETSSHCLDGCRYDRSNPGSEPIAANPFPLRWLYRDGAEAILFDERGPGAVTRLWMTTGFGVSSCIDPAIRLHVYVDGASMPTLDIALAALFDGSTSGFTPPLVADRPQSSGGFVSYLPIAYAGSLKIALTNIDNAPNPCTGNSEKLLWYQITHHRLVPGTPVTSYAAGQDFPAMRAFLASAGDDPWNAMLAPQTINGSLNSPGDVVPLLSFASAGWVRGLRLNVPVSARATIRLRATFDGETTIDMPLSDFFASSATAMLATRSVLLGEDVGGWLYSWFPMPFASAAQIDLIADATLAMPVAITASVSIDPSKPISTVGRFGARVSDHCVAGGDIALYSDRGAGKIVGISSRYHANGLTSLGYLEGDERATVDDAIVPAWYGTGVEDFYNGGFYFDHGAFAAPLAGASEIDLDGNGTTAVYRLLATDALEYASALTLTQEAGYAPTQPVPTCARTVVYAFRQPQPLVVPYDAFEIGDSAAALAHHYNSPPGAICALMSASFSNEPPTPRTAMVCRATGGNSQFTLHANTVAAPLRLRRTIDVGDGVPGSIAGAPAAQVLVDGVPAGWFPPMAANPVRRWQQQEIFLSTNTVAGDFAIEIIPDYNATATAFTESAWELRGGFVDAIFSSGFEVSP
ncbi:MAG: DUF2961 domain-containing protein [Dokdonella sp.]